MLNFFTTVDFVVNSFPEIRSEIENLIAFNDGELLPHIIFGQVVLPYFEKMVSEHKEDKMVEIAHFLEELANSPDTKVNELLTDTLLEEWTDEIENLSIIKPFLEKKTIEYLEGIVKFFRG